MLCFFCFCVFFGVADFFHPNKSHRTGDDFVIDWIYPPPRIPVTIRINDYIDYILGSRISSQTFIRHHCILGVLFFGIFDEPIHMEIEFISSHLSNEKRVPDRLGHTPISGSETKWTEVGDITWAIFFLGCTSPRYDPSELLTLRCFKHREKGRRPLVMVNRNPSKKRTAPEGM